MGLFTRVIDKILFAVLFLIALQVPILADHYRQYLAGFYDATELQVSELRELARVNGYNDVDALIDELKKNPQQIVRQDANNKSAALRRLAVLEDGIETLNSGDYFSQAWYMFSPTQQETLRQVLSNFSPSVPLSAPSIVFSLLTAILLNLIIWSPFWTAKKVKHWRHRRRERVHYG